jgi:hypothetical protein
MENAAPITRVFVVKLSYIIKTLSFSGSNSTRRMGVIDALTNPTTSRHGQAIIARKQLKPIVKT